MNLIPQCLMIKRISKGIAVKPIEIPNPVLNCGITYEVMGNVPQIEFFKASKKRTIDEQIKSIQHDGDLPRQAKGEI